MEEYEIFNVVYKAIDYLKEFKGGEKFVGLSFFRSDIRRDEYIFTIHFYKSYFITRFELKVIEEIVQKANLYVFSIEYLEGHIQVNFSKKLYL